MIGYRAYWIGQIAKRYNEQGPEGMRNRRHTTSSPVLSPDLQEELRAAFSQAAAQNQHWSGTDVATWMSERLGRPVSYSLGWSYLVKLKHSLQTSRPRHTLADAEEQGSFKRSSDRS